MGWKVNLQPKLMAESLRNEAWTIGLKEDEITEIKYRSRDSISSQHDCFVISFHYYFRTIVICSP